MKYLLILCVFFSLVACTDSTVDNATQSGVQSEFSNYEITVIDGDSLARLPGKSVEFIEEGVIDNGERQGFWITRRDRTPHRLQAIKFYKNGLLNGPAYTYENNGDLETSASYKNGKLNGQFIQYKFGHPIIIAFYLDGKLHGKKTIYYDDYESITDVKKIMHYDHGLLDGKVSWFNGEGEMTMQYIYKDGKMVSGGIIEE